MKNKFIVIIITIIVILGGLVLIFGNDSDKYLQEITYKKLEEKIKNNESFPLLIMSSQCIHCQSFDPKYKSVLNKYEVTSYYINLTTLTKAEKTSLYELTQYEGTPTVVFFKNGSMTKTTIEGDKDKEVIISKLKSSGFIK